MVYKKYYYILGLRLMTHQRLLCAAHWSSVAAKKKKPALLRGFAVYKYDNKKFE